MRSLLFLIVGLLLLVAFVLLGRLFSANYPNAPWIATVAFVVTWLLIAAFNMWVGVSKAGYSFADESPVFLLLFATPTALAIALK